MYLGVISDWGRVDYEPPTVSATYILSTHTRLQIEGYTTPCVRHEAQESQSSYYFGGSSGLGSSSGPDR